MSGEVLLDDAGDIWRLTLNTPERRNALSLTLIDEMHAAFDRVERARPAGLILDGAGPVFCAGLDLSDLQQRSDGDMLWLLTRIELMLQRLWSLPCRTIGLARKAAIGAGADILVCCQHRVLSEGGKMAFPGLGFGIFLGTHRLSLRIGEAAAERILAAGKPVLSDEALALGLVHAAPAAPEDELAAWQDRSRAHDPHIAAHLSTTVARADGAADMAALVASAARPGLRDRIMDFASGRVRQDASQTGKA